MASRTLRQAEKKALDGANESQDTLLVAHYLMMDYGVGLVSVAFLYIPCLSFENLATLILEHCAEEQLASSRRNNARSITQAKHTSQGDKQQKQSVQ